MSTTVGPTTLFQEDGTLKTSDFTPEGDSGADGLVDVSKPSDLASSSRQKLGSYLRSVTNQNYYHVSDSTTEPVVSSPGSLGTPPIPDDSSSNALNSFLSQALADARNNFNSLSANNPDLAAVIDKNSQILGHSLLNIDSESSNGAYLDPDKPETDIGNVPTKISTSLKSNRFSQSASFRTRREDRANSGNTYTIQRSFGEFLATPEPGDEIVVKNLAGIGEELIARSGNALSIALGTKVDVSNLNAREAYRGVANGTITDLFSPVPNIDGEASSLNWSETEDSNVDELGFTQKNLKTNGSVNSPGVPFAGIGSVEMKGFALASAIGVLALSAAASGIVNLIELTVQDNLRVNIADDAKTDTVFPLGQSTGRNSYGYNSLGKYFLKLIGVTAGSRSRTQRIIQTLVGTVQFYTQVIGASQGYYLSINRNVFRDLERLERVIDQSKHMWQGDNRNFGTGGSVALAVLESVNILLDTLGSSQTFKFANAMSNLGDICLLSGRGGFDGLGDDAPKINFRSDILPLLEEPKNLLDSSTPDVGNVHTKSRAKFDRSSSSNSRTDGMGLAWRFGAYSSAYILPTTLISAVKGTDAKPLTINDSYISNKKNDRGSKFRSDKDVVNGRITRESREKLEAHLNAAHMPFYFHDLRTNEIIAFWAFLEAISDSFTPEVNQVTGFGRMDNVQIYKRTGRSISLTFMAVATNKEDFDEMWFAINKLVTLVYPQYSRGSQRQSSDGSKFIMPFSQIPTASPLIRLRVGDLFASNRNPATERRIFGIGTDSFEAASAAVASTSDFPPPLPIPIGGNITEEQISEAGKDNGLLPAINPLLGYTVGIKAGSKLKNSDDGSKYEFKRNTKVQVSNIDLLQKAEKGLLDSPWVYIVTVAEHPDTSVVGKKYYAEVSQFMEYNDAVEQGNDFMNRDTGLAGAIVRSFDSAGGEGLAGMITQLDFDWMLNTMLWETDQGDRAPMGCKITISFTPIHDYQLGLNDGGEINAPAYMVGKNIRDYFSKQTVVEAAASPATKEFIETASKAKEKASSTSDAKLPSEP